jgi:hypothetical protein
MMDDVRKILYLLSYLPAAGEEGWIPEDFGSVRRIRDRMKAR